MQALGVAVGGPQYHKEMRWTGGEKAGTGLVGGGRKTGGAISSGWMGQVPWTGGVCLFLGGPIGCRDRGCPCWWQNGVRLLSREVGDGDTRG